MWKKIGSFLIVLAFLNAADIEITAAVDTQTVPVNQTVQYTLTFDSNAKVPGVNLPAIQDFNVVGQSSSTQLQIINGRQSGSRSIIFVLQPKKEGKAVIPGFSFTHEDQQYFTKPLEVTVGPAQSTPQQKTVDPFSMFGEDAFFRPVVRNVPAQDVFVEMLPAQRTLYVGEKTQLEFRFYCERGFYQGPQYVPPAIKGLVAKVIESSEKPETIEYNGKQMQMLRTVQEIYPLGGPAEIGPAQIQYVDSPFGGVQTLQTQPIVFTIKQLPLAPEKFSGAVGQFKLQAKMKNTSVKTGEPIALILNLNGQGNLDMVNTLAVPNSPSFNVYLDSMQAQGTQREYRYFLTPLFPGKYSLPDITFVYFDPQLGRYLTTSDSLPLITVSGQPLPTTTQLAGPDHSDSAINIRFDRRLLAALTEAGRRVLLIIVAVMVALGAVWFGYMAWTAPLRLIKRELKTLAGVPDAQFAATAKKIFLEAMYHRYKVKVTGMSTEQLQANLPQSDQAVALVQLFEKLQYAGPVAVAEHRQEILQSLAQLV